MNETNLLNNRPEQFRKAFILILVTGVTILFIFMVRDFLIAILLAGLFSGLLYPVYRRLLGTAALHNHPGVASAVLLVLAIIAIGIPLAGLIGIVTAEAMQISENVLPWIQEILLPQLNGRLPAWLPFTELLDPYKESIIGALGEATSATGVLLAKSGSALTQGTLMFFLKLFVMLYAMFFFFLRGPHWINELDSYLPLTSADEQQIINRGLSVTRASLKGILIIGLLQAFLIGLAFRVIGIEGAAFWGTIVGLLSAIPGIGPPLIWVPAAVYLFMTGQSGWGVALIIWGAVVVGTIDNILRPLIVSAEARMPDLLILVSTLGGIVMFGAIGIIIGPIVAASLLTTLNIYRHAFVQQLPGKPWIRRKADFEPVQEVSLSDTVVNG